MTEYFIKSKDEEGNEVYTATEDVVPKAEFDAYKVESEAKLNELASQQKEQETNNDNDEKEVEVVVKDEKTEIDIDKLTDAIYSKIEQKFVEREEKQKTIKGLLNQHKIPEELEVVLQDSANPEQVAQILGQQMLKFGKIGGSNSEDDPTNIMAGIFADVDKELGRVVTNDG